LIQITFRLVRRGAPRPPADLWLPPPVWCRSRPGRAPGP